MNESDKAIKDGKEIPNEFNKYFANIIKNLNLEKGTGTSLKCLENCRMVKTKFGNENFSFEFLSEDVVANAIKNLATGKASV